MLVGDCTVSSSKIVDSKLSKFSSFVISKQAGTHILEGINRKCFNAAVWMLSYMFIDCIVSNTDTCQSRECLPRKTTLHKQGKSKIMSCSLTADWRIHVLITDWFPAVENEWSGTSPHHQTPLCWAGGCRSKHSASYKRIQRSERKFNLRGEESFRWLYESCFLIINPEKGNLTGFLLFRLLVIQGNMWHVVLPHI